jgi:hypothetical protein
MEFIVIDFKNYDCLCNVNLEVCLLIGYNQFIIIFWGQIK